MDNCLALVMMKNTLIHACCYYDLMINLLDYVSNYYYDLMINLLDYVSNYLICMLT